MVRLGLRSKDLTLQVKSLILRSKHSRKVVMQFREMRVRPKGVHTMTPSTFSDYVVFVSSLLLMVLKY
jgi:hypothetical protein